MDKILKFLNYKNRRDQWIIHEIIIDVIIIGIIGGTIYFLSFV